MENDGDVDPENARFLEENAVGPTEVYIVPGADPDLPSTCHSGKRLPWNGWIKMW